MFIKQMKSIENGKLINFRFLNIFVCYNPISYTVAVELVKKHIFSIIIYDENRISPICLKNVYHFGLNNLTFKILMKISKLHLIRRMYIPHHNNIQAINDAALASKYVDYIDDGLDTLRNQPLNFDLNKYSHDSTFYTFIEYRKVGQWLRKRKLNKICSLKDFPQYDIMKNRTINTTKSTVVIESNGLSNVDVNILNIDAIVVGHPNPNKNNPRRSHLVIENRFNLELSLMLFPARRIFIGESMTLVYLIYFYPHLNNTIFHVYFNDPNNLSAITDLLPQSYESGFTLSNIEHGREI